MTIYLANRCLYGRPLSAPGSMFACNPSVAPNRWGYRAIVRTVNYRLLPDERLHLGVGDPHARSHNWLVDLDTRLRPRGEALLDDAAVLDRLDATAIEDLRLFAWRGGWWCCGTVMRRSPGGPCASMLVARIDEANRARPALTDATIVSEAAGVGEWQKNWLVWPRADWLEVSPWAFPAEVRRWDGAWGLERQHPPGAPILKGWRGSTTVAPWQGGGLAILHRRSDSAHGPDFEHRFVHFASDWSIRGLSPCFRFQSLGVEFACGVATGGRRVVIGYGIMDASAHIMVLAAGTVAGLLAGGS